MAKTTDTLTKQYAKRRPQTEKLLAETTGDIERRLQGLTAIPEPIQSEVKPLTPLEMKTEIERRGFTPAQTGQIARRGYLPEIARQQSIHRRRLNTYFKWQSLSSEAKQRLAEAHGYKTAGEYEYLGQPPVTRAKPTPWDPTPSRRLQQAARIPEVRPVDPVQIRAAEHAIQQSIDEPEKLKVLLSQASTMPGAGRSPIIQAYMQMAQTNTLPMGPVKKFEQTTLLQQKRFVQLEKLKGRISLAQQNDAAWDVLGVTDFEAFYPQDAMAQDPVLRESYNRVRQLRRDAGPEAPNWAIMQGINQELKVAQARTKIWAKERDTQLKNLYTALQYKNENEQQVYLETVAQRDPGLVDEFNRLYPFGAPPESKGRKPPTGKAVIEFRGSLSKAADQCLDELPEKSIWDTRVSREKDEIAELEAQMSPELLGDLRSRFVRTYLETAEEQGITEEQLEDIWNQRFRSKKYRGVKPPPITKMDNEEEGLPRMKTPAEARKLPPGTRFIDSNGAVRVRP